MSTFEIKLSNVPARLVTPILELVEGEGIAVETVNSCAGEKKKPRRKSYARNGQKGVDLAFQALSEKEPDGMTDIEMQRYFREAGMAGVSAQPRLNELAKAGRAVKVGMRWHVGRLAERIPA